MKITKYEHACLFIQQGNTGIVIDPGEYSNSAVDLSDISAIIITHTHPDHFDFNNIKTLHDNNPDATIYTVPEVAAQLEEFKVTVVKPGDHHKVGDVSLDFYGEKHAAIHSSYPQADNTGVLINQTLYYPGDSFTLPNAPVQVLAIPANAPWLKVGEAMDFLSSIKPQKVFPTHNAFLNDAGQGLADYLLGTCAKNNGSEYRLLKPGESIEV
jgi:L-ascorbate metabolism protein UlaG (beta-lactamase superfamily)